MADCHSLQQQAIHTHTYLQSTSSKTYHFPLRSMHVKKNPWCSLSNAAICGSGGRRGGGCVALDSVCRQTCTAYQSEHRSPVVRREKRVLDDYNIHTVRRHTVRRHTVRRHTVRRHVVLHILQTSVRPVIAARQDRGEDSTFRHDCGFLQMDCELVHVV